MQSPKAVLLRGIIQKQFRENKFESDQEKIHRMKQSYVARVERESAHQCAVAVLCPCRTRHSSLALRDVAAYV